MNKLHILILDDAKQFCDELGEFLNDLGHEVYQATMPSEASVILEQQQIDIAIVDLLLPEKDGMDILREIKQQYPYTEVIIITGHGKMDRVIEAMRAGAVDFIAKPFGLSELQHSIERTQKFRNLEDQLNIAELNYNLIAAELKEGIGSEIVGVSPAMKKVIHLAARVAKFDATSVLITGESGTGKELVARSIHALSQRKVNFFHSVNCSAIPESLYESEFFGHKKGAYTGAIENTAGWFEISHHGTLFLDEVAELPLTVQAKFLRVLDDKIISKVGDKNEINLDVRIIAATNQHLENMVEQGKFRVDLFHRLNTFVIHIPPLRERKEDIPELLNFYVQSFSQKFDKKIERIDEKVYQRLSEYEFPGNVRELKNMVEQALIISEGNVLKIKHFRNDILHQVLVGFDGEALLFAL
jgi:DNA-binding NtrC family response regulator